MDSFFFIPTTKLSKYSKVLASGPTQVIIDLEDSVTEAEKEAGLAELIKEKSVYQEAWIRVALRGEFDAPFDASQYMTLARAGYKKFVVPKLKSGDELTDLLSQASGAAEHIVLVEHPRLLYDLPQIIGKLTQRIKGVGLGSHDLMSLMRMDHTLANLAYPRNQLVYLAKAFDILSIDIASMNLSDEATFKQEVGSGIDMGYDAKFIIHPRQLKLLKESLAARQALALRRAHEIVELVSGKNQAQKYEPFLFEGQIIEKPHIVQAETLIRENDGQ